MSKKKQIKKTNFSLKTKGYRKEERVCDYLTKRGCQIISKNKKII